MINNRWLRLIAIGLVLLIALLIFLAYTLVDSRKVTALAVSAVEQATGRSLQVSGPVSRPGSMRPDWSRSMAR